MISRPSNNSDEQKYSDDIVHLVTSLSTEEGKFLRRTCPICGLDFKTEVDPAQMSWIIAPLVKRIGPEIGVSLEAEGKASEDAESFLYCPYCEARSPSVDTFTEDTVAFLHRLLVREIVMPMMNAAFAPLADNSRSRGFLSITLDYQRGVLPPRPIHGPEPSDMIAVQFLCCRKKGKVSEDWPDTRLCIYCGTLITLV